MRLALVLAILASCSTGKSTGESCMHDNECASNVCWDYSAHDPACFGTACSDRCSNDGDCMQLAADARAPVPSNARCGLDRTCDLVGTGLGSFSCAR